MTILSVNAFWVNIAGTIFTNTLWQGVIIGLSLMVGLSFLKSGDAKSRYNLAATAILAMLVWTSYDLVKIVSQASHFLAVQGRSAQFPFTELKVPIVDSELSGGVSSRFSIVLFFKSLYLLVGKYYFLIVPAWITGISLLSLRLAGGWLLTIKTRNRSVFPVHQNWQACLDYLVDKLEIGKKVLLKASFKVTSPMVIGYFKPVILIPASIISSLTYAEMEALLAHELAHIRRNDFLFICIQNVAEILLFYHPVTWMISSFLNKEREKCCDDIAVSISNDSLPFAKAITLMENLQVQKNMKAAFLLGHSNDLLNRIKRILHNGIRKSTIAERIAASLIIMTGLCLVFAFAGYAHARPSSSVNLAPPPNPVHEAVSLLSSPPDTLKKYSETRTVEAVLADDSSKSITSYEVTYENDTVKNLVVNKKKISRDKLKQFEDKLTLIKKLEMEHQFEMSISGWNNKRQLDELMHLATKDSKIAMEKALLDMQLHQQELLNMANSEAFKLQMDNNQLQFQKLQKEFELDQLMKLASDSGRLNQLKSMDGFFPKFDEKQLIETKKQMEKLQKQMAEEMHQFQQEFQKTHGKMLDSLKREMEKLHQKMPMLQGNALFDMQPNFFNGDLYFPGADLWKPESSDTAAMEDRLRKLEK